MESTQDTKTLVIPARSFILMMMILPDNLKEVIRQGVR
jgi:hypothetical protein